MLARWPTSAIKHYRKNLYPFVTDYVFSFFSFFLQDKTKHWQNNEYRSINKITSNNKTRVSLCVCNFFLINWMIISCWNSQSFECHQRKYKTKLHFHESVCVFVCELVVMLVFSRWLVLVQHLPPRHSEDQAKSWLETPSNILPLCESCSIINCCGINTLFNFNAD